MQFCAWHFFLPLGTNQASCLCLPLLRPSGSLWKHKLDTKSEYQQLKDISFFWKLGEAETLHQVARNWSELLGFGAKMAPTMKHNTCKINFEDLISKVFIHVLVELIIFVTFKHKTWQTRRTPPSMASFLEDMFSIIAPAMAMAYKGSLWKHCDWNAAFNNHAQQTVRLWHSVYLHLAKAEKLQCWP